jgi:hypothetical protein
VRIEQFIPEGGAYGHGGPIAMPTEMAPLDIGAVVNSAYPIGSFAARVGMGD